MVGCLNSSVDSFFGHSVEALERTDLGDSIGSTI